MCTNTPHTQADINDAKCDKREVLYEKKITILGARDINYNMPIILQSKE